MNLIKFRGIELGGNLMSLWKGLMSLCMVWLTWLFAVVFFFFFSFAVFWVCVRLFAVVFAFILRTEFSLYQSVTLLNLQRFIFKYSTFVLTPSSLPFFHPLRPPIWQRAVFAKAVIHALKWVKPTTTRHRNSLHQLPALKAPLPLTHPAGDWGIRYLTDDQEYWESHRTL